VGGHTENLKDHVVLCGFGRMGRYIGRALESSKIPYVVIEYNRHIVMSLRSKDIPVIYGDPSDIAILNHAKIESAKLLIVALPDMHTQQLVTQHASTLNDNLKIITRTHFESYQKVLRSIGANYVVQPEFSAAISVVERTLNIFGIPQERIHGKISRLKIEHGMA
jgi:CPA2 family monovalent cation:H+ antiporter-2